MAALPLVQKHPLIPYVDSPLEGGEVKRARIYRRAYDPQLLKIRQLLLDIEKSSSRSFASPTVSQESQGKEREEKEAAARSLVLSRESSELFDQLFKEVNAKVFSVADNLSLYRQIYALAIRANLVEILDKLHRARPISILEAWSAVDCETEIEPLESLNLPKIIVGAHLMTLRKVISLGLNLSSMEKHPFFMAIEQGKWEVAQFISEQSSFNTKGNARKQFLLGMIPYVKNNDLAVIQFCVDRCKLNLALDPLDHLDSHCFTEEYLRNRSFLSKDAYLAAHALLAGHEELLPLLGTHPDHQSIHLLACLEIALKSPSLEQMKRLQEVTARALSSGCDINFILHSKDKLWHHSLMSHALFAFVDAYQ